MRSPRKNEGISKTYVAIVTISTVILILGLTTIPTLFSMTTADTSTSSSSSTLSTSCTSSQYFLPCSLPPETVNETGSTTTYPLFNLWISNFTQLYPDVQMGTSATGSGTGEYEVESGSAQIGASDLYLSNTEAAQYPNILNIPVALYSDQINYNLPMIPASDHLNFSGPVLAGIYNGSITAWNNPQIAALQSPSVASLLPSSTIIPIHRGDAGVDTLTFTQYLSLTTASWNSSVGYGTAVVWPIISSSLAEAGNSGALTACQNNQYSIAYIGLPYLQSASLAGLGYSYLQNSAGNFVNESQANIEAAANALISQTPADERVSLVYAPGSASYPIVSYEYALVQRNQSSVGMAQVLQSFLTWAIEPNYGNTPFFMNQVNLIPLPSSILGLTVHQIDQINSSSTTIETSTSTVFTTVTSTATTTQTLTSTFADVLTSTSVQTVTSTDTQTVTSTSMSTAVTTSTAVSTSTQVVTSNVPTTVTSALTDTTTTTSTAIDTITSTATVTQTNQAEGSLAVYVYTSGGIPITGNVVMITNSSGYSASLSTDSSGEVTFLGLSPGSTYTVSSTVYGTLLSSPITVSNGQAVAVLEPTSISPSATTVTTTLTATESNGAQVPFQLASNNPSISISNLQVSANTTSSTPQFNITLTISGKSGTNVTTTLTIPKSDVPSGLVPTVYIDGAQASSQSFTQDANNFYVMFSTHFSTHQVQISFTKPASPFPITTLGIVIGVVLVVALAGLFIFRRRQK